MYATDMLPFSANRYFQTAIEQQVKTLSVIFGAVPAEHAAVALVHLSRRTAADES